MSEIPTQFEELGVDWFNQVLGSEVSQGDTVTAVSWERIAEGVGLLGRLARFSLTWAQGNGPASVIAKMQSEIPEMVEQAQMFGFYDREVSFYRLMSATASVRVPKPYYLDAAPEAVPFVILMEDLTHARVVDQLLGCSTEEAVLVAKAAARLHAPYWGKPELHELTWLPAVNGPLYSAGQPFVVDAVPALAEKWGHVLNETDLALAHKAANNLNTIQNHAAQDGPLTMCHYDLRLDNLLFDDVANDVCVIDFQLMGTHLGPFDLAYFLAWSVTAEQRAKCQGPMFHAYVDELASLGVETTTQWVEDTVCYTMNNVVSMAIMSGATAVVENERGEALVQALVERTFRAAADMNSGDLL